MDAHIITNTFKDDVLGTLDGVGIATRIATGDITASEAVEAAIARAREAHPHLNAMVTETFDLAREQVKNPGDGPFAGVPTCIKDTDDLKGTPTFFGSRALAATPAKHSSRFVENYTALGFVPIGKSALPEFGLTGTTEPLFRGATCNPWNVAYSTGGSSGGSAALVAAGVIPIAHGNDGGGSIRIPAACCGLVGLKPSRNRLTPVAGTEIMPINIVTHGILSRTVRDTAEFYFAAEKQKKNKKLPDIGHVRNPGNDKLKIGLFTEGPGGIHTEALPAEVVENTGAICEELGHHVEKIACPYSMQVLEDFSVYWGMLAFSFYHFGRMMFKKPVDKKKFEPLTLELSREYRNNMFKMPFVIRRLRRFSKEYARLFETYDVLVSPVMTKASFRLGYLGPDVSPQDHFMKLSELLPFTPIQNIAGTPALSLPMGQSSQGLPVGVQFAGAMGQERRLLELGFGMEQAHPWPRIWSTPSH